MRPMETPKCLLPIKDKTILDMQMEELLSCGIKDINLVIGHKAEEIISYVLQYYPKTRIIRNPKYGTRNNSYSLYLTLKDLEDSAMILNGDAIFLNRIIGDAAKFDGSNAIPVEGRESLWNKDLAEEMRVRVKCKCHPYAVEISKEVPIGKTYGQALGVYVFDQLFANDLAKIFEGDFLWDRYYEEGFNKLFQKHKVFVYPIRSNQRAYEIDTYDEYQRITELGCL